ncbi:uncharacterized protein C7orf50 homolog isoform X1 [Pangasianodon hypophthalmus]|uniref:uncharacterized protein C7orf50 homolog isoform X1 n=1 Tax=Pangasianodon hypophthalmus TaxID=310915 RepID=UPI002307AA47|nr:uncharacterized protein C7orf50 homolog isoform X1 [Pangasianodon hypophthalmus]
MKRKKTEEAPENLEVCVPISEVKKRKKKKKDGSVDSTDTVDVTDDCTNEELNGKKKSEDCEAVSGVKKKKKTKKEKDVHVDTTESADLTESCKNEELNGKKKETYKTKQPVITEKDGVEEEEGMEDEDGDEEELSPEERRVLERKLKKIRKKEEKKKQKEEGKSEKEDSKSSIAQTQALEYLTCWSEKRDEWKFQKTRQVWLLQHMYDSEKVSDAHFSVLLSYLEGLRGVAREITVQKAEALVRFGAGPEGEEGGATEAQKKTQRAREVIQILS